MIDNLWRKGSILRVAVQLLMAVVLIICGVAGVYFPLLSAPPQADDLADVLRIQLEQTTDDAGTLKKNSDDHGVIPYLLSFVWKPGEPLSRVRFLSLALHSSIAWMTMILLWLWLGSGSSILLPLLGGLLVVVHPATPAVVSELKGFTLLLQVFFFLASVISFLSSTTLLRKHSFFLLLPAAFCLAAGAACHPALVILVPGVIFIFAVTAVAGTDSRTLYVPYLLLVAFALAVGVVMYVNEISLLRSVVHPMYLVGLGLLFVICRVIHVWRPPLLRGAGLTVLVILLVVLGFMTWRKIPGYASPLSSLEQRSATSTDESLNEKLILYYYEAARHAEGEDRAELYRTVAHIHSRQTLPPSAIPGWQRLLLADVYIAINEKGKAFPLLDSLLSEEGFRLLGLRAAELKAMALDESIATREIVDLLGFVSRHKPLDLSLRVTFGKALLLLGDVQHAAEVFGSLPSVSKDTPEGSMQQQVMMLAAAIQNQQESANKSISQDPTSLSGYISSAEATLLSGNFLRAFYWLNSILRRSPESRAWELIGYIFARWNRPHEFVERWGTTLQSQTGTAWLDLAKRTATGQFWDAAYEYVKHYKSPDPMTPEEYLAIIALELHQIEIAEKWLLRAVEEHPDVFGPHLLLADIALHRMDFEKAERYLQNAEGRGAPEHLIESRKRRIAEKRPTT